MINPEEAYREYISEITAFCAALLKSREDGEDCAHEVFLTLLEKQALLTSGNIRAWLYSAARFKAMNMLRARRHTEDIGEYAELLPDSAKTDRTALIRVTLGGLERRDASLLRRRCVGDESARSLAAGMGISEQALNKRLRACKSRFRAVYEDYAILP